jgi:predicted DNA-binding protein
MTANEKQLIVDRLHVIAEQARHRSAHAVREAIRKLAEDVAAMPETSEPPR